jgi:drug/metabolite transporter (DMT)-like permease
MRAGQNNLKGAILLVVASAFFTVEVALVRYAGTRVNEAQIIFCRAFAQLVLVTGFYLWTRRWFELRTKRIGLHLIRGLLSVGSWWLYYLSFRVLDLTLATTLTFTTQLFSVAFAGPVLGERVTPARIVATVVGFLGVLVATGVGSAAFDPLVFIGITSAIAGTAIIFLSRALTATETTASILFYIGLITSLGALPVLIAWWIPPDPLGIALIVLGAVAGGTGMALMIEAYRVGEVSALAPFPYLRLVFAMGVGWLVFAEVPGLHTVFGSVIVVLAALVISRRL